MTAAAAAGQESINSKDSLMDVDNDKGNYDHKISWSGGCIFWGFNFAFNQTTQADSACPSLCGYYYYNNNIIIK